MKMLYVSRFAYRTAMMVRNEKPPKRVENGNTFLNARPRVYELKTKFSIASYRSFTHFRIRMVLRQRLSHRIY